MKDHTKALLQGFDNGRRNPTEIYNVCCAQFVSTAWGPIENPMHHAILQTFANAIDFTPKTMYVFSQGA
jgi:hypothetical protein